ncbi:mCG1031881, partial [Mus musculus]
SCHRKIRTYSWHIGSNHDNSCCHLHQDPWGEAHYHLPPRFPIHGRQCLKSHHCHGYIWGDPGMETFDYEAASWRGLLGYSISCTVMNSFGRTGSL